MVFPAAQFVLARACLSIKKHPKEKRGDKQ
jgi:hypothetical protein